MPSIEELKQRCAKKKADTITSQKDNSFVFSARGRNVFVMPYLDDETQPDFLKYKLPNPEDFYAKVPPIGRW